MSEFHIIGLGNLCEFVIKNIDEKQTYGTFSACDKHDRKSMQEFVDYVNQLIKENEQLKQENQRMTDKLNQLALEFLNYDMVTMGKATEISEMCYYDFLKYRKENGNPMELQL